MLRGGQVDFVDDRNDGEIVPRGEKSVGDGLRFDALARVHDQQRAFAGGKRAGNFVGKIHVAGRVDQVQAIFVAVARGVMQANALGLDGDAALALQVHGIEHLRIISRWVSAPVSSSRRSASVDLPWSMCAMMQKLRMYWGSMFSVRMRGVGESDALCARASRLSNYRVCHRTWGNAKGVSEKLTVES